MAQIKPRAQATAAPQPPQLCTGPSLLTYRFTLHASAQLEAPGQPRPPERVSGAHSRGLKVPELLRKTPRFQRAPPPPPATPPQFTETSPSEVPPRLSPCPIKAPSPLEALLAPSLLTQAPYRPPSLPQSTALPCPPRPARYSQQILLSPFPFQSPATATLATPSPLLHLGAAVWTPERSGLRGSAPPQKVRAPTPGSAHMSLAGRFFPSTMRMDSELRLAIAGPRRGVRARGSPTPGSGAAGRRAGARGTGRRGGRAAPGAGGKRGGGGIASTSFTPAPAPRAGATAPGRANRRPGLPGVGGAGPDRCSHWPPGGRGGACAEGCCPAGSPRAGGGAGARARRSAPGWPVPPVRVGGGRGPSASAQVHGGFGP